MFNVKFSYYDHAWVAYWGLQLLMIEVCSINDNSKGGYHISFGSWFKKSG